jgi:hypothetical protein
MAKLVRGPFTVDWGSNTLTDVEEVSIEYEQDSEEYSTIQQRTYQVDGAIKVSATITLLASDIPALAAVLPQYYIEDGSVLSTGETIDSSVGAIDVLARCGGDVYNDLTIKSCGNPSQVLRLVNCRTKIDSIENDKTIRKVLVKFIGESEQGEAPVQFFEEGAIS